MAKHAGLIDRALDIVCLSHPLRTALGVLAGVTLDGILQFLAPALRAYAVDPLAISVLWTIPLGVVLMHIPTIWMLFRRGSSMDETVQQALDVIDDAVRTGKIPRVQAGQLYTDVVTRAIARIQFDRRAMEELDEYRRLRAPVPSSRYSRTDSGGAA
jgi:hypothetical protein